MTATVQFADASSASACITAIDTLNPPSGEKVMTWVVGSKVGFALENPNGLSAYDDGTYITFKFNNVTYFKIRKSDGQFMVAGGYDSDVTL